MKKLLMIILILLFVTFFILSGSYSKTIERSFNVDPGAKFSLKNLNGNITISTSKNTKINIVAVKIAKKEKDLNSVNIIFEYDKEGLNVFSKGYKNNNSTNISYTVEIPEKLSELYIKTINGNIEGKGIFGDVTAKTVNGKIYFKAEAKNCTMATVNGNIHLFQKKAFGGDISIKSVNGSLKIELDDHSSLSIKGGTLNGNIKSDFPLKISRNFIGSSISGAINSGSGKLKLKTVNGKISIYRN